MRTATPPEIADYQLSTISAPPFESTVHKRQPRVRIVKPPIRDPPGPPSAGLYLGLRGRLRLPVFDRGDNHRHPSPFHLGVPLHLNRLAKLTNYVIERFKGAIPMSPFTPTKQHGELDFVPVRQKRLGAIHFD